MDKAFKVLPVGSLPYENEILSTKMMVKLFEDIPFLPLLPNASANDSLTEITLSNIPGIYIENNKISLHIDENFPQKMSLLENCYLLTAPESLNLYGFESFYLSKYYQVIKRIQPRYTVINLLGPFSILEKLLEQEVDEEQIGKTIRILLIKAVSVKALWIIEQVKLLSPNTKTIIIFEEPYFNRFGKIKRIYEQITKEFLIDIFNKISDKIHQSGGYAGIQCFEKSDWSIAVKSNFDIISFGAYSNPNNLRIMPKYIDNFIKKGGIINWGIVPVKSNNQIKQLTCDKILQKFEYIAEELVKSGVSQELLFNQSTISVQGNMDKLEVFFAEKAMMLTKQIADRIFTTH